jgi:Domain of unknown function (DUF1929)/Glyoxal oxidase N-terminus
MKPRDKRLTRSDVGTFRDEQRKILNTRQNEYFSLLGKDAKAAADLEKKTIAELRELAERMDERRHEQAPAWDVAHGGILDRLRKLSDAPRSRNLDPTGFPPRPQPEDFFEEPMEDLPDFGPQEGLCSVTTTRLDTTANHGETITKSPQSSKNSVAEINFDPTPGLNEVKMSVGIDNESKTADVAITAEAAWLFHFDPPAEGLYTIRPLAFLNGLWELWANTPGIVPGMGSLNVTVGVRISQFDGLTLFETAQCDVVSVTAIDENLEGKILYDSASKGSPLEMSVNLAKELRTHIIVRCTVSLRLTGSGLAGVNLKHSKFYFRVPEVQIDHFDCQGFLPSDRPRLNITPSFLAMRRNSQFQVHITADPPFDGPVQLISSNSAAASVISPINLQGGTGSSFVTAREGNRQLNISVQRDGYVAGGATVYVENDVGVWEVGPVIDDFVAVHAAVLHTGKVLMFSGSHETDADIADINKGKSFLWNWQDNSRTEVPISRNLFCSGHCFLADGRLLVAGGQNLYQESFLAGVGATLPFVVGADKDVHTFNPVSETWEKHDDLADKRWYPTCVTTPNGRGLIVGGITYNINAIQLYNDTRETFRPNSNSLTDKVYFQDKLLYPFLQVLPGDFLFVFNQRRAALWDLEAEDWLLHDDGSRFLFRTHHDGRRSYPGQGCCVPLTIDAADPDRILLLIIGGSEVLNPDKDSETTDSVEVFDFRPSDPTASIWRQVTPLPDRRFMCDGVLLADGTVFVTNGAGKGLADDSSLDRLASYIFEPWNNVWHTVEVSLRRRAYHSMALLLPDGRVLVGGSTGHKFTDFLHDRDDQFRLDIFTPPYLTRGPRPTILEAPDAVEYGEEFEISVDRFLANQISEVALMRPGSTTHSNNMDQRRVRLPVLERAGGVVRVAAPAATSVAQKGFYLLFVLNQFGVPSVAKFVRLG